MRIAFRIIACAALALLSVVSAAEARYCNNPYCSMCNRLFGVMSPVPQGVVIMPVKHDRTTTIESTPHAVVDAMLKQLRLTPGDMLYDLGCGDGRILIAAVQQYGCKAIGIEINPKVAEIARANVRLAGCGRITIQTGDARRFQLDKATAVTMYLFPPLMAELLPKLRTSRVVSYSHRFPGRKCRQVVVGDWHSVYVLEDGR